MGLTGGNFRASLRGKPVRVVSAAYDTGPKRVVIVVDVSGSMTGSGRLRWGLAFAQYVVSLAPPETSLALITFSNGIEDTLNFSQSRDALKKEIVRLQSSPLDGAKVPRKTALNDVLVGTLALLRPTIVGDAICLVTDGGENSSRTSQSEMEDLFRTNDVRLFAFFPTWRSGERTLQAEEARGPGVAAQLNGLNGRRSRDVRSIPS